MSGNSAANGGALYSIGTSGTASTTITNSTLTGNSPSGASIVLQDASLTVGNSVFNAVLPGTNIMATGTSLVTSLGYNLSSDTFGGFLTGTGEQTNKDPILGPLKNNGGPTLTHAPLSNSPTLDQGKDLGPIGPAYTATGVDQRGAPRPVTYLASIVPPVGGDRSDIGAVELAPGVQPTAAVSRKTQGAAGDFDIPLNLSGLVSIECRTGGLAMDYQLILTFATPITFSDAVVTSGIGTVSSTNITGTDGVGGTTVTINLTGVANAQRLTVALLDANDGTNVGDVGIRLGIHVGDITGEGTVSASDISSAKASAGQPVTNSNFRNDVTANGVINATDIGLVKARSGQSLPPALTAPILDEE